jgi:hypothetical protein
MKKSFLLLPLTLVASGLLASTANAYESDITVTAYVDTALGFMQADGTPIPKTLEMSYVPTTGLKDINIKTRLYTNDTSKNLLMRLGSKPQLANTVVSTAPVVPLTVSFMGSKLDTAADLTIKPSDLIWDKDGASQSEELKISQATQGKLTVAGTYSGTVNLIITQSAATTPAAG